MLNDRPLLNLIATGLLLLVAIAAIAEPKPTRSSKTNEIVTRVLFKPPPEDMKPKRTRSAGSRNNGQCSQDTQTANLTDAESTKNNMMPLVPSSGFGLTLAKKPTLWVYLPETSAKQVVLSIQEEGITHHSQTFISITGKSGMIKLQPSGDSPPLEVGKSYQWAVILVCGKRPSPNDPVVTSWVRRVALADPIQQGSMLDRASWYGEQGIWYDALTYLMQARKSQPNNQQLIDIWTEFLQSGGLNSDFNN
ncbi:MAG TPA: hypothetical protein DCF68_20870 [Cyanothece sp. UBA12306]|nr:hypothetical protein [Cyanothece sp. UBA12306]